MDIEIDNPVPFAVVKNESLPWCCLLGLNFIKTNNMTLDFEQNLIIYENSNGEELYYPMLRPEDQPNLSFQGVIETENAVDE